MLDDVLLAKLIHTADVIKNEAECTETDEMLDRLYRLGGLFLELVASRQAQRYMA